MKDDINYLEIVERLISEETLVSHIVEIISEHADNYKEKKNRFYINLSNELSRHKQYVNLLLKKPYVPLLKAGVDGVLLYLNSYATEWQPLFIIGPSDLDVHNLGIEFEERMGGGTRENKLGKYRVSCESYNRRNIQLSIRGGAYINKGAFSSVSFSKNIGEEVKKEEIIGTILNFDLVSGAKEYLEKHDFIEKYCGKMIREIETQMKIEKSNKAPTNAIDRQDAPVFLENIFIDKFKYKYLDIIKVLAEDQCDEYPSPFIRIEGDKTIWETGITYSFSYLAGLFGALLKLGWIKEKKEIEFMQIARDTFHIEVPFSRTAFQKMKTRGLDEAFINPFEGIFKRIK